MPRLTTLFLIYVCLISVSETLSICPAQDEQDSEPIELEVLKASLGIWDAEIEVWPEGIDSTSIKFEGVETNRAFGKHWIASDFDSEFSGQKMSVHSIVGYDLEKKQLVGTVIDHGPYAAKMTGKYDESTNTVTWITKVKDVNGKPLIQKTTVTQNSDEKRVLVLFTPGKKEGEFNKMMEIKFVKRN